ncbi:MAG: N-acetylmuramoyl-L-alanine amidase [Tannerellaceae bacterium]|nr:N-acetylmuramoyl-L-alanine amidase [Tannerellaceae bacterium]
MNRKFFLHIYLLFGILFFLPVTLQAVGGSFTVIIDPGHGGKDPGAVRNYKEKDIVLAVSLKLGKLITDNHKDVKVIYTRSTDKYLTLNQRADIANKHKADLFISIHTNSTDDKVTRAKGSETYTLGLARTEENLKVAMKENAAILLEEDYMEKYEGFDPKSAESYIVFEFMQNAYMEQSIAFASEIETALKTKAQRTSRGVKQAGLLVLRETGMPSVLVELGFINNPDDEKFMNSADGQTKLANSLYTAFAKYKREFDRKEGIVHTNGNNKPATTQPATTPATNNTNTAKTGNAGKIVYKVQVLASEKKLPANSREFKGYKDLDFYQEKGLYKYTYGETTDFDAIREIRKKVAKDFKDAFIVKFKDGKKITN